MTTDESDETRPLLGRPQTGEEKKPSTAKKTFLTVGIGATLAALGFVVGLLIGVYVLVPDTGPCLGPGVPKQIIEDADPTISKKIIDAISATNIRSNLHTLTLNPHLGGTPPDEDTVAHYVYNTWKNQGLDYVTNMTYDVLLSYPNDTIPNQVFILKDEDVVFSSAPDEKILVQEQNKSGIVRPFAAFSGSGTVEGDLVYVNYGRLEDFKELTETYEISVEGRIVIARYGKIFRGDKAKFAQQYKAIGLVVYNDPADYTNMSDPENVFPNSWWLPPTGVQRGSYFPGKGDPLTPGYPSTASAYRLHENETELLTIPVQPISYGDAIHFFERLVGDEVPKAWRGGLNITKYRFGPGFNKTSSDWKVRLAVHTYKKRVNTTDVVGIIRGNVEPDRYVILGNHRDAWVFGGVDPSSGTATMLELSRVIINLVEQGWRPKRSLMFCSWGSEEPGLVGSFEWVEEYIRLLEGRAVVYLNVDSSVNGDFFTSVDGAPLLFDALYEAAKKVPTPNTPGKTLYDEWLAADPAVDNDGIRTGWPKVGGLGAGTDHAPFIMEAGISGASLSYVADLKLDLPSYPLYHSAYDLFMLVDKFIDPGFTHSKAIAQMWGELARNFADSLLLPMNASIYAREVLNYVDALDRTDGYFLREYGVFLDQLYQAANTFVKSADDFHERRNKINRKNPIEVRQFNDQLMQLERAFVDPQGVPDHPIYYRHVIFAPSSYNSYTVSTFPGLTDLLFKIKESADPQPALWDEVRRHLAAIIFATNSASAVLQNVSTLTQSEWHV